MKIKSLIKVIAGLVLLTVQSIQAEVKLPAILSSDMILQRNTNVKLWGWASANEKITIKTSWQKEFLKTKADNKGNWQIEVQTTNSKAPQTINFKGIKSNILLDNILFGEVWLCSGQSNMRQPLKGYTGQPVFEGAMAIAKSTNNKLRLFSITENGAGTPLDSLKAYKGWEVSSPASSKDFSAIAYFYGKQLQEILDVPVGLIMSSWGGTRIQPWISKESLLPYVKIDLKDVDPKRTPAAIFNAMINPITKFAIKGVLWYQGETNRNEPEVYKQLFPVMVKDWRKQWGIGDFPFYYAQIAPYQYDNTVNSAFLREAQFLAQKEIPNSGMAVLMDIGAKEYIHPPEKVEVANRLLLHALSKAYRLEGIDSESPAYKSYQVTDSATIVVDFNHVENGIYTPQKEIVTNFEIAGEDRVFYKAEAKIIKARQIEVWSNSVKKPVAVRYAFTNYVKGTLYNTNMLPASSFRTDNWDYATKPKE
jgi:sialate O-acetylesterase